MKMNMQQAAKKILFLTAAFLIIACGTVKEALVLQDNPSKTIEKDGLTLNLTFLNDEKSRQLYGNPNVNPFLTAYNAFTSSRVIAFELTILNQSSTGFTLSTRSCSLKFGDVRFPAKERRILEDYWQIIDEKYDVSDAEHKAKVDKINKHVPEEETSIPASSRYNGILVFTGETPNSGTAKVTLSIRDEYGRPVPQFEFTYNF